MRANIIEIFHLKARNRWEGGAGGKDFLDLMKVGRIINRFLVLLFFGG